MLRRWPLVIQVCHCGLSIFSRWKHQHSSGKLSWALFPWLHLTRPAEEFGKHQPNCMILPLNTVGFIDATVAALLLKPVLFILYKVWRGVNNNNNKIPLAFLNTENKNVPLGIQICSYLKLTSVRLAQNSGCTPSLMLTPSPPSQTSPQKPGVGGRV